MSEEHLFLIVDDEGPADQAAQLQQSLMAAGLSGKVKYAASPAEMLGLVRKTLPSLILLDHHWSEVKVESVLEDLRREAPGTRVVIYTGKKLDPTTIISCARFGVAQYLMKSSGATDLLAKTLYILANKPDNTIEKLSAPSGAVQQLIQEAEKAVKELESERTARRNCEAENASLRSSERREIYGHIARFVVVSLYVCLIAALLVLSPKWGWMGNLVILALGVFGLFVIDRSLLNFDVKAGKYGIGLRRKPRE